MKKDKFNFYFNIFMLFQSIGWYIYTSLAQSNTASIWNIMTILWMIIVYHEIFHTGGDNE